MEIDTFRRTHNLGYGFRCLLGADSCLKVGWSRSATIRQPRTMGNRFSNSSKAESYNDCDLTGFEVDDEEQLSDSRRTRKSDVDWNDENSVHHRSAMNCLHNYALGKMTINKTSDADDSLSAEPCTRTIRRTDSGKSITFADNLEQTFVFMNTESSPAPVECPFEDHSSSDSSNDDF
jgi:hypothetical protein